MIDWLPANSHVHRKRKELHRALPNETTEDKPFVYIGCCVDFEGKDINEMTESGKKLDWPPQGEHALDEIRRFCIGIKEWSEVMGYVENASEGLTLENDWHLVYGKGEFYGISCYWISHSGIEYIWIDTSRYYRFNTAGLKTGRIFCDKPNMANIPRTDLTPEEKKANFAKAKKLLELLKIGHNFNYKMPKTDYASLEKLTMEQLTPAERVRLRVLSRLRKTVPVLVSDHSLKEMAKTTLGFDDDPDSMKVVPLAIDMLDIAKWGCPYCGFHKGQIPTSAQGTFLWQCLDCRKICHTLITGLKVSAIGHGGGEIDGLEMTAVYPKLSEHPLKGQPPRTETKHVVGK